MGLGCDPLAPPGDNNACGDEVFTYLNEFRQGMLNSSLDAYLHTPGNGAWLCNCYTHILVDVEHVWDGVNVPGAHNQTGILREVFHQWYTGHGKDYIRVDGVWGSNVC